MPSYGDYQTGIYMAGLRGIVPDLPVDFATLERRAEAAMSPTVLSYVQGACGDELTQRRNAEAFQHWGIMPRMMVDSSERDLSVELFGLTLPSPLFMCPVGMNGITTRDQHGDVAAAAAARMTGVPLMQSTLSNDPLETVAAEFGEVPGFFQLYTPKDKALAESLVERAEAADYKAIVVTLDTWIPGWRPRDLSTSNFPQLRGHVLANYFSDPTFRKLLAKPPEEDAPAAIARWAETFGKVLTWNDMAWLKSITKLPIVLKGICHPDDAKRAVDAGADAIYCSTHGGRQANGGIAAIDMLPGVVAASGGTPVLFDSGIRSGTDIVKALALGATAVGGGATVCLRPGTRRRCGCGPCPQVPAGGSRPAHGGERLPEHRRAS